MAAEKFIDQPQSGQQQMMGGPNSGTAPATGVIQQGASTLFWIVSLFIGVAIGALAYVVVLQL